MEKWQEANKWEHEWWGDCSNTFNEEAKQFIYAHYLGLDSFVTNWYGRKGWNLSGKTVLDIGGGPVSILLKCAAKERTVVDPCDYPIWVEQRYADCGVNFLQIKGEQIGLTGYDEVWIYNVLQHVDDPKQIIENALAAGKIVRIFEWVEAGITDGHIHNLTAKNLDEWLGGVGKVLNINWPPVVGLAYFGVFRGKKYEKV